MNNSSNNDCKDVCSSGCIAKQFDRVCPFEADLAKACEAVDNMDIAAIINNTTGSPSITSVWGAMRAIGLGADAKVTVKRLLAGSYDDYSIHTDAGFSDDELRRYGFK